MNEMFHILVVGQDRQDSQAVRDKLGQNGGTAFRVQFADSAVGALDCLARERVDAVLFDPLGEYCYGLQGLASIRRHAPNVPLLVWTTWEDPDFAQQVIEAGAHDCLIKNRLTAAALARALQYAIVRHRANPVALPQKTAVVAGVLGVKGGVGTTTLAAHLSAGLHQLSGEAVLLCDLDLYAGQTAFLMKADSAHSIADAVANVHRLDTTLFKGLVAPGLGGVDVLPSPCLSGLDAPPEIHRVRFLFRVLRSHYPWILVDLARSNGFSVGLLSDLDYLLLVTTPDLQALVEAKRLLPRLADLGCPREKIRLLLNRVPRRAPASAEEFERLLSFPLAGVFRDSHSELSQAALAGSLLPADSEFGQQITAAAAGLAGREAPKREGLIASLAKKMNTLKPGRSEEAPASASVPEP